MHPFSYTGLKIIHDQKIQEALEQQRLEAGQEVQRQGLLQTFGKFLARFNDQPDRKQEESLPGCAWCEEDIASCCSCS
jgi:hypothetical protein